jgi:hypothetical protein
MALQSLKRSGTAPSTRLRRNAGTATVLRASKWHAAGTQAPHLSKELVKLKSASYRTQIRNRGNGDADPQGRRQLWEPETTEFGAGILTRRRMERRRRPAPSLPRDQVSTRARHREGCEGRGGGASVTSGSLEELAASRREGGRVRWCVSERVAGKAGARDGLREEMSRALVIVCLSARGKQCASGPTIRETKPESHI